MTHPQKKAMLTSSEIKRQVAMLMRKLAEAKETERKAVEEEECWQHIEEEEGHVRRSVRSWSSTRWRRQDVRSRKG